MPLAIIAGLGGLALGLMVFLFLGTDRIARLKRPFRFLEVAFHNKFWFDELYREWFLKPTYAAARLFTLIDTDGVDGAVNTVGRAGAKVGSGSAWTDNVIVDGFVRLIGAVTQLGGTIVSMLQSGRVRLYLSLSAGVIVFVLLYKVIL